MLRCADFSLTDSPERESSPRSVSHRTGILGGEINHSLPSPKTTKLHAMKSGGRTRVLYNVATCRPIQKGKHRLAFWKVLYFSLPPKWRAAILQQQKTHATWWPALSSSPTTAVCRGRGIRGATHMRAALITASSQQNWPRQKEKTKQQQHTVWWQQFHNAPADVGKLAATLAVLIYLGFHYYRLQMLEVRNLGGIE